MDDKFKIETKRLAEVAQKLEDIAKQNDAVIVKVRLRCPRCGDTRLPADSKCSTCDLPVKLWS